MGIQNSVAPETLYLEIIRYGLYVIGIVTTLGIGETLRRLIRIEKKQDESKDHCLICKEGLREEFINHSVWEDWKKGRDPLWNAVNHHTHEVGTGRVVKS